MRLSIGVTTYNRVESLSRLVTLLRKNTANEFDLVVADDGSSDGTQEWAKENGVILIEGRNMGSAWNRNRALYHMITFHSGEQLYLIEDDMILYPHWDMAWTQAVDTWGHVCWALTFPGANRLNDLYFDGRGTPQEPFWLNTPSAQIIGSRRGLVMQVGYFDTRFTGYSHDHIDFSMRYKKLLWEKWKAGRPEDWPGKHGYPALNIGGYHDDAQLSAINLSQLEQSRELLALMLNDEVCKPVFHEDDPEERAQFFLEHFGGE